MKLLLLITLLTAKRDSWSVLCILTAGATTFRISPRAGWQFGNVFECKIPLIFPMSEYNYYGCYCGFVIWNNRAEDLDRCCQTRDHCHAQIKKLESCKFLLDNPYITSYTYLCSGNEVTCSGRNNTCEDLICNCDREAAICFSQAPYNKENKGIKC
ncbi:phospholipase A2-like [Peromyscus californicus insignis]|uniref:phospholipase A2-like n=1 Tax=Peromyscus californicus insignis TaxID=564181 RepID=UPI0022A7A763|nr:phospholipase A2-like [Peromyscus californicus insignis]